MPTDFPIYKKQLPQVWLEDDKFIIESDSFRYVIKDDLKIMDTSAISLSKENNIAMVVDKKNTLGGQPEFDITDIFHSVILTEIEHQCGVGSLKSFNFSILPVQEKDKKTLSQRETEICKRDLLGEKTTN